MHGIEIEFYWIEDLFFRHADICGSKSPTTKKHFSDHRIYNVAYPRVHERIEADET